MFSSSSKPKFALDLTINELTNVPQINGSCYIEIAIKDSKRTHYTNGKVPSDSSKAKSSTSSNTSPSRSNTTRSLFNKFDDLGSKIKQSTSLNKSSSSVNDGKSNSNNSHNLNSSSSSNSNTSVSGHVSTTTSRKRLHNFRCVFNYKLSCNLKFGLKKKGNLISNKYLIFKIYYIHEDKHHSSSNSDHAIIDLGRLEINLAEYLNFNEPVNTKYLLEDSKVNSILNITIGLHELPSNFDFHTQLQIQDNNSSNLSSSSTSALNLNQNNNKKKNNFNVPQFEKKNVYTGINNVLGDNAIQESNKDQHHHHHNHHNGAKSPPKNYRQLLNSNESNSVNSSSASSQDGKSLTDIGNLNNQDLIKLVAQSSDAGSGFSSNQQGQPNNQIPNLQMMNQNNSDNKHILMDPIVSILYCKILESNWDPELYPLLDYSPNQCIDDIFNNPENPFGCNLKLKKYYNEKRSENDKGVEDDSYRELNGLINEVRYRPNLKSWTINEEDFNKICN
ncbi:hypothetical protein KGF54_005147 [Candida jiufengensis]|uniref:uncharacterized protein n=1 Tax=Candida jiufengensis TaxID=497108 RepID=UPI002224E140|nr:uncharacterized protein KGF54_005147 [Candida jiufengensis]KAI5950330.1 hypothetical protein KGF54_005147 [Candida jiufengensis]